MGYVTDILISVYRHAYIVVFFRCSHRFFSSLIVIRGGLEKRADANATVLIHHMQRVGGKRHAPRCRPQGNLHRVVDLANDASDELLSESPPGQMRVKALQG